MSDKKQKFVDEIKAILETDDFKADIRAESEKALKTLKESAESYLNDTGKKELEIKGARLLRATARLETMTDLQDIAHQQRVIDTISRAYELRFTTNQIAKEQELIKAREAVMGFLKKASKDFAVIAAKVAIKHGVAALKEGLG